MKGFLTIIALLTILTGCQSGGKTVPAVSIDEKALTGEWLAQDETKLHLTLNDGGNLVYCKGELCAMGKWKISGDKLVLNYTEAEKNVELELTMRSLTNGALKCEYSQGKKVVFLKETNQ
jgi:uncharacterized protein (TIGR03066 family)